ncbi:hypothetical protein LJB78_00800, partial [Bacteroidales bacterium OttesenSCG-928-J16]|nr:hypothetical protein [Bacteroidales bacterium OttesenSCG-928-J16]
LNGFYCLFHNGDQLQENRFYLATSRVSKRKQAFRSVSVGMLFCLACGGVMMIATATIVMRIFATFAMIAVRPLKKCGVEIMAIP